MAYRSTDWGLSSKPGGEWREDALCARFDPEIWFPVGQSTSHDVQEEHALEVCRRCPVRARCTSWAVENAVLDGVWGVPEAELRSMVRARHGFHVAAPGRKELCVNGHALAGENLYVDGRGKRSCRECRCARRVEHRARLRESVPS